MRTRTLVLLLLSFAAALSAVGLWKDLLVVKIGSPEVMVPVSEGDVFFRTYMHSMYQVPVSEKFRIRIRTFQARSCADAKRCGNSVPGF